MASWPDRLHEKILKEVNDCRTDEGKEKFYRRRKMKVILDVIMWIVVIVCVYYLVAIFMVNLIKGN